MDNPNLNSDNVGEFHNKQCEVYYGKLSDLVKAEGAKNITPEQTRAAFSDLIFSLYGDKNTTIISAALKGWDSAYGNSNEAIADIAIRDIRTIPYKNKDLVEYLIKLIEDTKKLDFDTASKFFDDKLKEANSKFKGTDLEVAKSSINTGKASYAFWSENYDNWYDLFSEGTTATAARGGRTVGIADTACFVSGAIWGAIGGTATLPGVGTVTGALAVGTAYGLYGSLAAGVYSIVSSIFG